jgi:hypothetical protein
MTLAYVLYVTNHCWPTARSVVHDRMHCLEHPADNQQQKQGPSDGPEDGPKGSEKNWHRVGNTRNCHSLSDLHTNAAHSA